MSTDMYVRNKNLQVTPVQTGDIKIIDSILEDLITADFMDSETMPSDKLLSLINDLEDQLGLTWKGATTWDPLDRNLGGAIFMTMPWRQVE
jgi:hypothetical protein